VMSSKTKGHDPNSFA